MNEAGNLPTSLAFLRSRLLTWPEQSQETWAHDGKTHGLVSLGHARGSGFVNGAAKVFQDLQVARVDQCCGDSEGEGGGKEEEGVRRKEVEPQVLIFLLISFAWSCMEWCSCSTTPLYVVLCECGVVFCTWLLLYL